MPIQKLNFAHRVLMVPESPQQAAVRVPAAAFRAFGESIDRQLRVFEARHATVIPARVLPPGDRR